MRFDGIIFDLDGTLWDACQAVADSWGYSLFYRYGIERQVTVEESRSIMGLTELGVEQRIFSVYGMRAGEVCHNCLIDEGPYIAFHGAAIYPGVGSVLAQLREKAPLFIVSNCMCGYIEAFMTCSGYGDYFSGHMCEGSTGLAKADNIRLLVEKYGLKRPVYIGDTATDQKSADEAGCPFIHAAYGFGSAKEPLGSISDITELPALLERL